jgi:peptidoglycan/LPS O-acetylase OafA/YrhL
MRGVAVILVVAYHGERALMPRGGTIGVTMFFTLSGFLITTLLLRERATTGRISLRRFYWRRALRLLPALVTLVAVTCAYALVTGNQQRTLDAAVPVLLYFGNWMRTLRDAEGLGLLEHTWSLSVEEQFYVVWPLAVLAAAALVPKVRQAEAVLVLAVAGSAASLWWRLQLWDPDEPRWSAARLYNGTDAVADQLLVGAALAAALALWDRRASRRESTEGLPATDGDAELPRPAAAGTGRSRGLFAAAGTALAPLALAYLVFVARVRPGGDSLDNDRRYLEWGSLTFAIAGAIIVLGATRGADRWFPRLLSWSPLVAVGKVSYGIYLWHFPVILVVDEQLPDAPTAVRAGAVLALTAATTLASWFVVERPFLALKDGPRTSAPAPPRQPVGSGRP